MEAGLGTLVDSSAVLRPPRVLHGIVVCTRALRACYDCTSPPGVRVEGLRGAVEALQGVAERVDSTVLDVASRAFADILGCVEYAHSVSLSNPGVQATATRAGVATQSGALVFYAGSASSWYGTMLYNAATDLKPCVEYGARTTGARKEAAPVFDPSVPSYVIVVEAHVWAAPLKSLEAFLCRMCLMVSDRATCMDARWLDRTRHPLLYGPEAAPWLCLLGHQVKGPHSVTNVSVRTWMTKTQGRLNLLAALQAARWLPELDVDMEGLVFAYRVSDFAQGCVEAGPGPVVVAKNFVDVHGAAALQLELSVDSVHERPLAARFEAGQTYEEWALSVYDKRGLSIGFAAFASDMLGRGLSSEPVLEALGRLRLGRVGRLIETHLVRVVHSMAVRACVCVFTTFFATGTMGDLGNLRVSAPAIGAAVGRVLCTWSPAPLQLGHETGGLDWLYIVFATAVDSVLINHIVPVCEAIACSRLNARTLAFEGAAVLEETAAAFQASMCQATRVAGVPGTQLGAVDKLVAVVPYVPTVSEPALDWAIGLVSSRTPSVAGDVVCVGLPHDVIPNRVVAALSEACFGLFAPESFVVVPTSGLVAAHPYAFTLVGPRVALDLYFRYINPANVLSHRMETWGRSQVYEGTGDMPLPVSPAYSSALSRAVRDGLWVQSGRRGLDVASSAILSMTLSVLAHPRRVTPDERALGHLVAMVVGLFGLLADVASDPDLGADVAESNPWATMVEVMQSLKDETLAEGYNTANDSIRGTHCVAALVAALFSGLCDGSVYDVVLVGVQTIVEAMRVFQRRLDSSADAELAILVRAIRDGAHRASEYGEPLRIRLTRAEFEDYAPAHGFPLDVSYEDDHVIVTDTVLPLHARVLWVLGHPSVRSVLQGKSDLVSLVFRPACSIRACEPSGNTRDGFGFGPRTYVSYFAFLKHTRRAWADKVFQNALQDMLRPRSVPMRVPEDDPLGLRKTERVPWPSKPSWGEQGGPIGELTERIAREDLLPDVPCVEGTALRFGAVFFEVAELMVLFAKNSASLSRPSVLKDAAYVHAMRILCLHGMTFAPLETAKAFVNRDPKFSRCSGSVSVVEFSGIFADIVPVEGLESTPRAVCTIRGGMSCGAVATASYPYTRMQCSVQSIVREGAGVSAPDPFGSGGPTRSAAETDYPVLTPYTMVLPTVDAAASFGPVEASGGLWSGREVVPLSEIQSAWDRPGVRADNVRAVLPALSLRPLPVSPLSALGVYAACAASVPTSFLFGTVFPARAFAHALRGTASSSPMTLNMNCLGTMALETRMPTVGPGASVLVPEQARGLNDILYGGRAPPAVNAAGKILRLRTAEMQAPDQSLTASLALHRMAELGASFPKETPLGMQWRMKLRFWSQFEYDCFGDSYDLDSRFKNVSFGSDAEVEKFIEEHGPVSMLVRSSDVRSKLYKRAQAIRDAERAKQEAIEAEKKRKKAERDSVPQSALRVRGKLTYDSLRTAADLSVFKGRTRKRRRGGKKAKTTKKKKKKDAVNEAGRDGIVFSTESLVAGILSTPKIIASMGDMKVDDLLKGVSAEDEEKLRPRETSPDEPVYVFDEPVTADNIVEACEGVYQIAGVFMSLRESMARQGSKAWRAGDFLRAGFVDLFTEDNEDRDPRVLSEEAVRDVIASRKYASLDAPESVVLNSISAGSTSHDIPIELPSISHSRVAAMLQWAQPRALYDDIIKNLKIVADKFPNMGTEAPPPSVQDPEPVAASPVQEPSQESYVPLSPQYGPQDNENERPFTYKSPAYAPPAYSVCEGAPAVAEPTTPHRMTMMDNNLIRNLSFATDFGIDVGGSHLSASALEVVDSAAYCVVCKSSDRLEEMESFCPCWAGCSSNMVHLDCACTLDFFSLVSKSGMRTGCGQAVPGLFCDCRVHSAENIDKILVAILCAEFPLEAQATRSWRPNQVPGHKQLGPRQYVQWENIRYVNWRRHPRYIQLRDAMLDKFKKLPPSKVGGFVHQHRGLVGPFVR